MSTDSNTGIQPTSNSGSSGAEPSRVDKLTGVHTVTIVVGILVALILISILIVICVTNDKEFTKSVFSTTLSPALLTLVGFFAGSATLKNKS